MVWVRSASKGCVDIRSGLATVRAFLRDVPAAGRLMPSVRLLEPVGGGVYHYVLEEFSNGAVSMAPDYEVRFDLDDPAELRWEPHGEHPFRSWGAFRTRPGPDGETTLEIDTQAEVDLPVNPVVLPLVRPFAQQSSDEVTRGFLAALKAELEAA